MLGNRPILTPSASTLNAMFGDAVPIGDYAKNDFSEKLSKNLPIKEKVKIICDYAESLNEEQSTYDAISPWGGLDITVQQVDEIALNTVFEMYSGEELQQTCKLLRTELNARNIKLIYAESVIESYEKLQNLPEQLEMQYGDYQEAMGFFTKNVEEKVLEIREHGKSEYAKYEQQFNEIQNSPLKRLLGKIPCSRTCKELISISESMGNAYLNSIISEQDVIEKFFNGNPIYSAPHYWSPINSDEPEMKIIETGDDLDAAIEEIHEQLFDPKNKEAYVRCINFLQF